MRPRYPLYLKITGASLLVGLVVLGFLAGLFYRDLRTSLQDKFGLTLQHIAQTAALFVDGEAHQRVRSNGDATGADFQHLRDTLERVRRDNELAADQIYTLRPVAGGQYEFVVMLQQKTFVGDRYTPPAATARLLEWVLADGVPRYSQIYSDANGTFVSGYAPIRDASGKPVAVLEVDYDVARFVAELHRDLWARLWAIPATAILALLIALLVARSITHAVGHLVAGTSAVEQGDYEREVRVDTRDELRTLADSFNHMLGGLRERFAMLKFVPRHTREVIAASTRARGKDGELAGIAEKRDVAVFFSDIRGFTALSDKLPPDRVIQMLNIYLRKEAEIIERHGGSIDKFIGDAVMAVFEGDDRFARAVAAAVEVQAALAALNGERAFEQPIEVGIGIAGGDVVMGSVGYEARLEFAVIGRLVNLASRLCSLAARGEIVVSELAWQSVEARFDGERREGVKLKGFADEVTCWRVRGARASATVARA